jgi:formylglycine-generating enzyme required for sulfatase activity
MKKGIASILLTVVLSGTGCTNGLHDIYDEGKAAVLNKVTFAADNVYFIMSYVPGGTFPTGTNDLGIAATVAEPYWIGETEVTYELWQKVYHWATTDAGSGKRADGGDLYSFANPGLQGGDFTVNNPVGTDQHPVTMINWRDSMAWCNALTEWYNARKGTGYTCVYTYSDVIIRDSRDSNAAACDGVVLEPGATGFRLLASDEWELAARWRNDATNTVAGFEDPYFTKGNSASGAYTFYNDATDTNPINGIPDGKDANDLVAVYYRYWNGSWQPTGIVSTAGVKSKGGNGVNSLGLYDMSGNVVEWCFDLNTTLRVRRGGGWQSNADSLQVGNRSSSSLPQYADRNLGFRFAKSAQ